MTDTNTSAERLTIVTVLCIGADGDVACGSAAEDHDGRADAIERARDTAAEAYEDNIGGQYVLTIVHIDTLPMPKLPTIQVETVHPELTGGEAVVETSIR